MESAPTFFNQKEEEVEEKPV
jgi:hypothetical protein